MLPSKLNVKFFIKYMFSKCLSPLCVCCTFIQATMAVDQEFKKIFTLAVCESVHLCTDFPHEAKKEKDPILALQRPLPLSNFTSQPAYSYK